MNQPVNEKRKPCADKLAFDTEKEAKAVAATESWRHDAKLKVYKCRNCGLWHLTSQPPD